MLERTWPSREYVPEPSWRAGPRGMGMGWPGMSKDMRNVKGMSVMVLGPFLRVGGVRSLSVLCAGLA